MQSGVASSAGRCYGVEASVPQGATGAGLIEPVGRSNRKRTGCASFLPGGLNDSQKEVRYNTRGFAILIGADNGEVQMSCRRTKRTNPCGFLLILLFVFPSVTAAHAQFWSSIT